MPTEYRISQNRRHRRAQPYAGRGAQHVANSSSTSTTPEHASSLRLRDTCVVTRGAGIRAQQQPQASAAALQIPRGALCTVGKRRQGWLEVYQHGAAGQWLWLQQPEQRALLKQPDLPNADQKTVAYSQVRGKLFVGSVKPQDVMQGYLEDCFLVGALGALAAHCPQVIRDAIEAGPGADSFTVTLNRFDDNGSWLGREKVVVDNWFPSLAGRFRYALGDEEAPRACLQAAQQGRVALWPAVLEKAFAKMLGGYDALQGGEEYTALAALTGRQAKIRNLAMRLTRRNIAELQHALEDHRAITVASKEKEQVSHIHANHVYLLAGIDEQHATLRNPHDGRELQQVSLADFYQAFERLSVC